jgi:peroxiredoxin Q/BCP
MIAHSARGVHPRGQRWKACIFFQRIARRDNPPDPIKTLKKFVTDQDLNFKLLSDEEKTVHMLYGAYGKKSMYGREYEGVLRSTFVIDEKGKITLALYNVKATGHVTMLRKQLGI